MVTNFSAQPVNPRLIPKFNLQAIASLRLVFEDVELKPPRQQSILLIDTFQIPVSQQVSSVALPVLVYPLYTQ